MKAIIMKEEITGNIFKIIFLIIKSFFIKRKIKRRFNKMLTSDNFINWIHVYNVEKDNELNKNCKLDEQFLIRKRVKTRWIKKIKLLLYQLQCYWDSL